MADPTLIITFGDDEFPLSHVTAQEVIKAKTWTGCRNRRAWYQAIGEEEPEALLAALVIAKQRKGEQIQFADADYDLDAIEARLIDDQGREVEPVLELNPDGSLKTNPDGEPIQVTDKNGKPQWRDVTTGDVIPFGISESKTTSDIPPRLGSSSGSDGGSSLTA